MRMIMKSTLALKPLKPLFIFSMAIAASVFATSCTTVEHEYDDDDDDDHPRRVHTSSTTVEERRVVAPAHQETRVIRSY